MIRFECSSCGYTKDIADKYANKKVLCPKCNAPNLVPNQKSPQAEKANNIIKVRCPQCNKKIGVTAEYAGRRVRCANCKSPITIPIPSQPQDSTDKVQSKSEAKQADKSTQQAPDNMFADTQDLLNMEQQAKTVYMPELAKPSTSVKAERKTEGSISSEAEPETKKRKEKPSKKNMLVGAVIAGCVIVAAAIMLIGFPKTLKKEKESAINQTQITDANNFALKCLGILAKGEVNDVSLLLTSELQAKDGKTILKELSEQINKTWTDNYTATESHAQETTQGNIYWFNYNPELKESQNIRVFVRDDVSTKVLEGIVLADSESNSWPIFLQSELCIKAQTEAVFTVAAPFLKWGMKLFAILLVLSILTVVSMAIVFYKADEPAWAVIIPIYNCWVLARVGGRPGILGLALFFVSFVPLVGPIISIALMIYIHIGVAHNFGRGILFGLGLCFLSFIFWPILAFSA